MDTNPTSIRNMLLGLEMANQVDQSFVKVHFHRMTTKYSNWFLDKIVDKETEMVAMRKQFLKDNCEETIKTTMNSKEGSRMTKYLAQRKSIINKKRKDWRQSDLLIFGFEHVYLKVDVKTVMFRNYLGFAS